MEANEEETQKAKQQALDGVLRRSNERLKSASFFGRGYTIAAWVAIWLFLPLDAWVFYPLFGIRLQGLTFFVIGFLGAMLIFFFPALLALGLAVARPGKSKERESN